MYADVLAINPQGLDRLRFQASQNGGRESVRAAAQQFEAYFLQLMLRSMRQTLAQDGPFDSAETRMFGEMFDQQVALGIAQGKGVGLAEMLVRQLQGEVGAGEVPLPALRPLHGIPTPLMARPEFPHPHAVTGSDMLHARPPEPAAAAAAAAPLTPRGFVDRLWPYAAEAAAELGVSPHLLLAQAALESGWGRHELRLADGRTSYNLFNIKVGRGWQGERVTVQTEEYVNGRAEVQTAQFRAYGSYTEAFMDYARLLKNSPRYAGALNQGGDAAAFARALQQGGYATDPMYADKILRVLNSATFRNALAGDVPAVQG